MVVAPPRYGRAELCRRVVGEVCRRERPGRLLGAHVNRLFNLIDDAHRRDPRVEVFHRFADNSRPSVAWRAYFKNQLRDDLKIGLRQRALGDPRVAVIGNIRAAHGVGITFSNHSGIIAQYLTQLVLLHEISYEPNNPGANLAMARLGHVHGDNPPPN